MGDRQMRRLLLSEIVLGFLIGVAISVIVLLSTSDIAAHYDVCEKTRDGAKECATYGVVHFAMLQAWHLLDSSSAFITAVATGFIAWFTLSLRQSTDKLWDAGERQLQQIRDSTALHERPWLFVNLRPHLQGQVGEYELPVAMFDISNHGRMPAIIDECHITLGGSNNVPEPPLLRDEFHGVIGPAEKMENRTVMCPEGREYDLTVDLAGEETFPTPRIGQDEEFFFFIILHYRDIVGSQHSSRFCWRYDRGMDYWVKFEGGGDCYNQIN